MLLLYGIYRLGFRYFVVYRLFELLHFNAVLDVDSVARKYRNDMGHKNAKQRRENVRGVFNVKKLDNIQGKKILLVDDVMTSGATFYEINRVLRKAGASAVYAVSFCRVVHAI